MKFVEFTLTDGRKTDVDTALVKFLCDAPPGKVKTVICLGGDDEVWVLEPRDEVRRRLEEAAACDSDLFVAASPDRVVVMRKEFERLCAERDDLRVVVAEHFEADDIFPPDGE